MRNARSSLFLMELVIVILFFSLSSAVCVQLFVKAHQIDQNTVNMNHSMIWIQNYAEAFRADPEISAKKQYFDKEWHTTKENTSAAFSISLEKLPPAQSDHGVLKSADIQVLDLRGLEPSVIASQIIECYIPLTEGKEASHE